MKAITLSAQQVLRIMQAGGYQFGPADLDAFMRNILAAGVAEQVRAINLPSSFALQLPWDDAALVFIDGAHEYGAVSRDLDKFAFPPDVAEITVAIHDSTGAWEGPTRVVQEALADGWRLVEAFDMTSVLVRAK